MCTWQASLPLTWRYSRIAKCTHSVESKIFVTLFQDHFVSTVAHHLSSGTAQLSVSAVQLVQCCQGPVASYSIGNIYTPNIHPTHWTAFSMIMEADTKSTRCILDNADLPTLSTILCALVSTMTASTGGLKKIPSTRSLSGRIGHHFIRCVLVFFCLITCPLPTFCRVFASRDACTSAAHLAYFSTRPPG